MLLRPCWWQRLEQIIQLKRAGLPPSQDRLSDIRRDQSQAEDAAQIRIVDLLRLSKFCRAGVLATFEHLPPAMGADDGLDQRSVDAQSGRPWCRSRGRQNLFATAPQEKTDGDTNRGRAPIFADVDFGGMTRGHAASRWVVALPVNSLMRE